MNVKLLKQLSSFMRYSMLAGTAFMTVHCGFLLCGISLHFAEWICGLSIMGFCMLFVASIILSLGNIFRAQLTYLFLVKQLILYQRIFVFDPEYLGVGQLFVFIVGIGLVIWFVVNLNQDSQEDVRSELAEELANDEYREF